MPKINTDNPGARQYLLDVARYWLDFGIDGWRLDVATEIDHGFWQDFRKVVKTANPEAYIVGEIWHESQPWLQGDQFDAVMNYFVSKAALPFFGAKSYRHFNHQEYSDLRATDASGFAKKVDYFMGLYDWQIVLSQLNLLDSHDTPRAIWLMGDDPTALRLSALFQMTIPGAPCIYYGTEIGMTGASDPYCRGAFPWDDQSQWVFDLRDFYRKVINLRKSHPVLRTGSYDCLYADGDQIVYKRTLNGTEAIIALNAGNTPAAIAISAEQLAAKSFYRVWPDNDRRVITIPAEGFTLEAGPRDATILLSAI